MVLFRQSKYNKKSRNKKIARPHIVCYDHSMYMSYKNNWRFIFLSRENTVILYWGKVGIQKNT